MTTDTATSAEIMTAIERGKEIITEWKRINAETKSRHVAAEKAEIAKAWQPVLATIQQATPSWVHSYIITPDAVRPKFMDGYLDTYLRPATIDLSTLITNIPPIRVWATPHSQTPSILFEADGYFLVHDDTDTWIVTIKFDKNKVIPENLDHFQPDSGNATDYFHVALAEAYENISGLAALQTEADHRNAAAASLTEPVEADETYVPPAPIDPLKRIAIALERIATSLEVTQPF